MHLLISDRYIIYQLILQRCDACWILSYISKVKKKNNEMIISPVINHKSYLLSSSKGSNHVACTLYPLYIFWKRGYVTIHITLPRITLAYDTIILNSCEYDNIHAYRESLMKLFILFLRQIICIYLYKS